MTAEIGALNRLGVALAADSAVTLGRDARKIYTSAEKLFQLADRGAVGIMVYGNARFLGVPWEVIIKIFRAEFASQTCPTVRQYADSLVRFLTRQKVMFPKSEQADFVESLANSIYRTIRDETYQSLEEEKEDEPVTEKELRDRLAEIVRQHLDRVRPTPPLDGLPDEFTRTLRKEYRSVLAGEKKEVFKSFPLSQAASRNLTTLVVECMTRQGHIGNPSGVVIAGFGEAEHYPCLVDIQCHGIASDRPLLYFTQSVDVGPGGVSSAIVPFAQGDMALTFLEGVDPKLKSFVFNAAIGLLPAISQTILDDVREHDEPYAEELEERVKQAMMDTAAEFVQRVETRIRKKHIGPVVGIVGALPKDELAAIAESLVNLTKFKRRVTAVPETVGGPIDVAVITKGDGFVWVKRKHYFKPELNPRFFAKYGREA